MATDRIVCLGDSITDGCTYPQILIQALKEAGKPVPAIICAGVASDTAPQMAGRLEPTVLRFKPSIVTFCAGTNDSLRGLSPASYEKALRQISTQVKALGGTLILLTPCIVCPSRGAAEADKLVDEYAKVIREVAAEEGHAVAENNALLRAARRQGKRVMVDDGIHPNYFGQSLMARSILDAMGYRDVPLPKEFRPQLFPGIVREWQMRLAPPGEKKRAQRLNDETVRQLRPDASWKTYTLPDPAPDRRPTAADWWEQERRNGFGLEVRERIGKGLVQAVAVIECDRPRSAFVNTGIGISTAWLNGRKIHQQGKAWTGFHAGKERIPVELQKGRNRLIVEIEGPHFFLSVTDRLVWEEHLR